MEESSFESQRQCREIDNSKIELDWDEGILPQRVKAVLSTIGLFCLTIVDETNLQTLLGEVA